MPIKKNIILNLHYSILWQHAFMLNTQCHFLKNTKGQLLYHTRNINKTHEYYCNVSANLKRKAWMDPTMCFMCFPVFLEHLVALLIVIFPHGHH